MKRSKLAELVFVAGVLVAARANGDIPPPDTQPCQGKAAGASCELGGKKGACQKSTCSRLLNGPDGPSRREYACMRCVPVKVDAPPPPKSSLPDAPLSTGWPLGAVALFAGLGLAAWFGRRPSPPPQ